ncbi:MAG: hypothetical protein IPJ65_01185 [Archangiaceae bacterium]|nr:hypothetical protein [Archangiaceae bacterium]
MFVALPLLLAAAPLTLAAPGIRCAGVEQGICDAYLEHFSTQLAREGRINVRTRNDIAQVLDLERQKQLLGCDDAGCIAELVGGLGVDAVLSASVTHTEASWFATLRVLRARDGAELASASERFDGSAALEKWMEAQADTFAEKLAPQPAAPPTPRLRTALFGAGAVALVAGVVLFAVSKADASTLANGTPTEAEIPGIAGRGRVLQPLGLVLGIAGLGLLGAATMWLALEPGAPAVSLGPVPGGAMFSFAGALP